MPSPQRPQVLVIDDDPDFHALIEFMLQRQQCDARCVNHPDEISSQSGSSDIDVILLDWQLGELDGTSMIEPLHSIRPASGLSVPATIFRSVDLPAPFRPSSATAAPVGKVMFIPSATIVSTPPTRNRLQTL